MTDNIEANLSDLPPETQFDVLRSYPKLIKILVKRLGGKIDIPARSLEQMDAYTLVMGMNPKTKVMRLSIHRPKQKEKMN